MIVVSDFTELASDPRNGGVSARDFGASEFCFDVDPVSKLVAVWSDENGEQEPNAKEFKIYDFDRELKFSLREPIIYAKFEPRARQIWLARRDSDERITILIYGYDGELSSNLALPDELRGSGVWMDELPETGGMAVGFGAGQDGSRSFLLRAEAGELNLTARLADDFSFLFAKESENGSRGRANEQESEKKQDRRQESDLTSMPGREQAGGQNNQAREAALINFYESEIAVASYPELKPLRKFRFPDELTLDGQTREFMLGGIAPLGRRFWLVRDDGYFRHYVFDAREFKFIAEIALAGFEPAPDSRGEITSQICDIACREGKLIFTRYELGEPDRYFEADAAQILARAQN